MTHPFQTGRLPGENKLKAKKRVAEQRKRVLYICEQTEIATSTSAAISNLEEGLDSRREAMDATMKSCLFGSRYAK